MRHARRLGRVVLIVAAWVMAMVGPALGAEKVFYYGSPMDLSRIYTFLSHTWEQASRDYVELVNLRGGVGGYRFEILVADHANEPQRVIELYERYRRQGAFVFNAWGTPGAYAVLPRAMRDQVILFTPAHGRGDAADGQTFPWVFPMVATYWSQAAGIVDYIYQQEGQSLKGKRIAFVHIDTPFGREPIPVLRRLSDRLGFELGTFAYPAPGNEQSGTWAQVRRFRPDWIVLWGAGVPQPVSVGEAVRNGFSLGRVISVSWLAEEDVEVVGRSRAVGVQRVEVVAAGRDFPLIRAILDEVYGKGRGHGEVSKVGSTRYNEGVAFTAPLTEAVRIALDRFGEPLTADKVRRALESLTRFDAEGMMAPVTVTPTDHEGGGAIRIARWDGSAWVPVTGWFVSRFRDVVLEVVREQAASFRM